MAEAAEYSVAIAQRAGFAVRMRIKRVDLADADTIRACFQAFLAAQQVDEPDGPWFTERPFQGWLTVGWGGGPREVWVVPGLEDGPEMGPKMGPKMGTVAGWYRLELPDLENLDQAELTLVVHPAQRRRGIGRALLKHVRRPGRPSMAVRYSTPVHVTAPAARPSRGRWGRSPGWWTCSGSWTCAPSATSSSRWVRETAEQAATGYSLVSWTGLVPEDFLEQAAVLFAALNDAPHDPHVAPAVWDAQRVRERVNDLRLRYGLRTYGIAAVTSDTGEPAG